MGKKIIISETAVKQIMAEEFKKTLSTEDIKDIIRKTIKDDKQLNNDIEKKVKNLVANAVNMLFKTLWQRHNFYEDEIKK